MTSRERFLMILDGKKPDDRIPVLEIAPWWDRTIKRWETEGMPANLTFEQTAQYFGLDELYGAGCYPAVPPARGHGAGIINGGEDYERVRKDMYSDSIIENWLDTVRNLKPRHDSGELVICAVFQGFFWHPRALFGIEPHLYAFYDDPGLIHTINRDLLEFNMRALQSLFETDMPDYVIYSEDMSYNHGSMVSKECFDDFILPYYLGLNQFTHQNGLKVFMDSDGDITEMIPWILNAGMDGIYPLERQAGIDIIKIRDEYPQFLMMGGYDKMAMNQGEEAIRAEFERILPVMHSGRYIPSVDHQTPPGVSLEDYKLYLKILKEYCKKAVNELN